MSLTNPASENAEAIRALEENFWSMWSNFGRGRDCALHDEDDALWFDTPISSLPYNTVLRFTGDHDIPARVDRIVRHYAQRDVPFAWVVHPTAPEGLVPELLRHGMSEIDVVDGMVADLADLPPVPEAPGGFDFREVVDEEDARQTYDLIAWRWKIEPDAVMHLYAMGDHFGVGTADALVRIWAAYKEGSMVSKTVLHCAAGAAGVYGVATRPEVRGNGIAGYLVLRILHEARRDGHTTGILHSSPMATNLYRRMGFQSVAPFRVFATGSLEI
jgi:GNAT superfamily N-acetyltransferase